jgi:ribosomal protein S18 acetylase RimI-like enzyme
MNLKLVEALPKYFQFIRELRFHPDNVDGFVNQNVVSEKEQEEYMKIYSSFYKICLMNEEPVGFVGVVENDIRVAVKPEHKKKGIAKYMIENIMVDYPYAKAKIKVDNTSSIKLFESCGFKTEFIIMKK